MTDKKVIVVCGPTAVGKTKYAIEIAKAFDGEIVSCDSMQLYKYMNIGSAKPTPDEQAEVFHYLIDQIDPRDRFSVADYQGLAKGAINEIFSKGKTPVIEGGTGLYLNSLLYDMDFSNAPEDLKLRESLEMEAKAKGSQFLHERLANLDKLAAERIHPNNTKKLIRALEAALNGYSIESFSNCNNKTQDYEVILTGLTRNREELYDRINLRVDIMMSEGLLDEVKALFNMGLTSDDISMKGIGYKEIIGYLNDEYSLEDAVDLIKKNSRHLAKRQLTWFKRYSEMKWFNLSDFSDDKKAIEEILEWLRKEMIKP